MLMDVPAPGAVVGCTLRPAVAVQYESEPVGPERTSGPASEGGAPPSGPFEALLPPPPPPPHAISVEIATADVK